MEAILFILTALTAVVSSLLVVTGKKPINSILFLIVTFFCVAVLYLMLGAEFIAAMQIIVYAGAIMVLFLFVVMLLNLREEQVWEKLTNSRKGIAGIVALGVLAVVITAVTIAVKEPVEVIPELGSVESIAERLFTRWILPFEMASVLLLTAIIGVVMMVKRKEQAETSAEEPNQ